MTLNNPFQVLHHWFSLCLITFAWFTSTSLLANDAERLIATIQKVDSSGQGNREAAQAWQLLADSDAKDLPAILAGLDGCSPLAANWIRAAIDTIAERHLTRTGTLPAEDLEQFLFDTHHDSRARRLAYEWLTRVDKTAADRIIPIMLHDPGIEFRRDAVARLLTEADLLFKEEAKKADSIKPYRKALDAARDEDQITTIAAQLRELGQNVDVARHFGFLMVWKMLAPFDNTGGKGFDFVYPPEEEIKLDTSHEGKLGPVEWIDYTTDHDYGMVDLNQPFGKLKGVVGYAYTEFSSDQQQEVQLRLGCKNAWKVWLNGKLLFQRAEYHQGMRIDQYSMQGVMQPGQNSILVKACQNETIVNWTVQWQFQLRVCDSSGTAILSTTRPPSQQTALEPPGDK